MAQLPEHLNTNTNTTSSVIHQKGCLSARQKSTMTIRTIFLNYSLEKNDLAIGKFGQGARYQTLISIWPQGRDWAMNRTSMFNNELYDASLGRPVKPWRWGRLVEYICYCSVTTVVRQEGKISRADVLKSPNRLWVVVVYISLCWSKIHLGQG